MANLKGKIALVTGSTSGIGAALALALARSGADVMLHGLGTPAELEYVRNTMAESTDARLAIHGANLQDVEQIHHFVEACQQELGTPDILINNAGRQHVAPVEEFAPNKWDQILAVNLSSAFHTIRLTLPFMKAKKWGRIINMASTHGLRASPYKSAYVAAKHGLIGLTKSIALEVAKQNITCNAICPGYVRTPLIEAQIPNAAKANGMSEKDVIQKVMLNRQPTGEFVGVEELAALALYLCSDDANSLTASALPIDGGWTAQ